MPIQRDHTILTSSRACLYELLLLSERESLSSFKEGFLVKVHMLKQHIGYFGLCLGGIVERFSAESETESETSVIH